MFRLPTWHACKSVFLISLLVNSVYSGLVFLYDVPRFLKISDLNTVLGTFGYVSAFILVDALLLFGFLLLLAWVLPHEWLGRHFAVQGSLMAAVLSVLTVMLFEGVFQFGGFGRFFVLLAVTIAVLVGGTRLLMHEKVPLSNFLDSVLDRLQLLAWLYCGLCLLGVAIVVVRTVVTLLGGEI